MPFSLSADTQNDERYLKYVCVCVCVCVKKTIPVKNPQRIWRNDCSRPDKFSYHTDNFKDI